VCAEQFHISTMVLRAHQDKTYPGAMVASLSVPWGNTKEEREAGNTLGYLRATQLADGHWNQNQWLGGKPYWTGVQLDETALPVLLATLLAERNALEETKSPI
jgi:glucoamylase